MSVLSFFDHARPGNVALRSLTLVRDLLLANLAFNMLAIVLGLPYPFTSFLSGSTDSFGDFFKFALSFPGGSTVAPGTVLREQVARALAAHDYAGAAGLKIGLLTHFHTPPLTVLICLTANIAMRALGAGQTYLLTIVALIGYWCHLSALAGRNRAEVLVFALLGVISYPMLLMIDRGNVYAGLTALLVIHAILLVRRGGSQALAAMCLAIAVNIRPNAIIFLLPLIMLMRGRQMSMLMTFGMAAAALAGCALLIANTLYPDYTMATFRVGLAIYYRLYVVGNGGLGFGSSLFGAIKFLTGYRAGYDTLAMLIASAILIGTILCHRRGSLSGASLLFLICAAYTLGSAVIADYHLLVFLVVPMLAANMSTIETADGIALLSSCLILAPKSYVFNDGVSWQVVANPFILLIGSITILALARRSARGACAGSGYLPVRHATS